MANVKVAVRIRPLTDREKAEDGYEALQVEGNCISLLTPYLNQSGEADSRERVRYFSFDYVYPSVPEHGIWPSLQQNVYKDLGIEALNALFEGYNACVLAHGQSGAGKTYTMMGTEEAPGLIPQICTGFFARVAQVLLADQLSFRTDVSYLEIYNEKVRDLLRPPVNRRRCHLRVREHPKLGPYVQDLSRHVVNDAGAMLSLVQRGSQRRVSAATHYHSLSSRSHAIFTIHCTAAALEGNLPRETTAKLHLVDLAGSERANKELSRIRLKEGSTINKSLVTLGNVINALAESSCSRSGLGSLHGSCHSLSSSASGGNSTSPAASPRRYRQPYIPYRDSVLTWLLKDSLGGNSRTVMVATVSPSSTCYSETLSTLRYASRTKHIVNRPVVNEEPNVRVIRELRAEVQRLKGLLHTLQTNGGLQHVRQGGEILLELLNANETRAQELTQEWMNRWYQRSFHREPAVLVPLSLPIDPDRLADVSAPEFRVQRRFSDTAVQTSPSHLPTREIEVEVTNSYFTLNWPAMGQSAAKENPSFAASTAVRLSDLEQPSSVLYDFAASDPGCTDLIPVRDNHSQKPQAKIDRAGVAYTGELKHPSELLTTAYFFDGSQSLPTTPRESLPQPELPNLTLRLPTPGDLRRGVSEPQLEIDSSESHENSRSSSPSSQMSQDSFFGPKLDSQTSESPRRRWSFGADGEVSPVSRSDQRQSSAPSEIRSSNPERRLIPIRISFEPDFQNSPVANEDVSLSPLPSQRRIGVDPVIYASPTYSSSADSFRAIPETLASTVVLNDHLAFLLTKMEPATEVDSPSDETDSVNLSEDSLEESQIFQTGPKPALDMDSLEDLTETITLEPNVDRLGNFHCLDSQFRYPSGELTDEDEAPLSEMPKKKAKRPDRLLSSRLVYVGNSHNSSDEERERGKKEEGVSHPRLRPKRQRALEKRQDTILPQSSSEDEEESPKDRWNSEIKGNSHVLLLNHLPSVKRPPLAPFNTFDLEDPEVYDVYESLKSPRDQRPLLVPCNTIELSDKQIEATRDPTIDTSVINIEILNSFIDDECEVSLIDIETENSLIDIETKDPIFDIEFEKPLVDIDRDPLEGLSEPHFIYSREDVEENDFLVEYWEQSNDHLTESQLTFGTLAAEDVNSGNLYTINEVPEDCSLPSQEYELLSPEVENNVEHVILNMEITSLEHLGDLPGVSDPQTNILAISQAEVVVETVINIEDEVPQCLSPHKHVEGSFEKSDFPSHREKRMRSRSLDSVESPLIFDKTNPKLATSSSVDHIFEPNEITELQDEQSFRQNIWQDMKQLLLGYVWDNDDSKDDVRSEISGEEIGNGKSKRKSVSWTDLSGCGTLETDMEKNLIPKFQEQEQQIRPIIKPGLVILEDVEENNTDFQQLQDEKDLRDWEEDPYMFYDRHRGRCFPKIMKRRKLYPYNTYNPAPTINYGSSAAEQMGSDSGFDQSNLISEACCLMTRLNDVISNLQTCPSISPEQNAEGEEDDLDLSSPYLELCDRCFQLFDATPQPKLPSRSSTLALCPTCSVDHTKLPASLVPKPQSIVNSTHHCHTTPMPSFCPVLPMNPNCRNFTFCPTSTVTNPSNNECCSHPNSTMNRGLSDNEFYPTSKADSGCKGGAACLPCYIYVHHVFNGNHCCLPDQQVCPHSRSCSCHPTKPASKVNRSCQTEAEPRVLSSSTPSEINLRTFSTSTSSKRSVHLGSMEALSQQLLAMRRNLVAKTASRKTLEALRPAETEWL